MEFRKMKPLARTSLAGAGIAGLVLASPYEAQAAFSTQVIDWAIKELCGHMQGHLGGLLVAVAALGALVAAAMGSYRAFYSAIITAVGAFAISTILSLNFREAADQCKQGGGGGGGGAGGRLATAPAEPGKQAAKAAAAKDDFFSDGDGEEF